jgi:phosphate-selective porin OprO/OprP
VLKPFSKGGWGALQLNGRVDYLDLDSGRLKNGFSNNFVTGVATPSLGLARGGKQLGLLGSLIWIPEDYFRIYFQYARAQITGGPQAAVVEADSSRPVDERKYGVDTVTARAQIDF